MPGTAHTWVDGDIFTAARGNALPRGIMGTALGGSSDQTGITTATDITGASFTFTAISSRQYETSASISVKQLTAGGVAVGEIADGAGTVIQQKIITLATNDEAFIPLLWVETGLTGDITRKLRVWTTAGTLTVQGGNRRAQITTKDIGV